jgi:hypothetical protein
MESQHYSYQGFYLHSIFRFSHQCIEDCDFGCFLSSFSGFRSDLFAVLGSSVLSTIAWYNDLPTHIFLYVWAAYIAVLRRIGCCLRLHLGSQDAFVWSVVTRHEEYPRRPTAAVPDSQINYEFTNDISCDGFIWVIARESKFDK